MVVNAGARADIALDQRFHLSVENVNHEAPVAAEKVRPELVIHSFHVSAEVWRLDVRLLQAHVQLLVQCVHQTDEKLVRVVLPSTLELLVNFAKGALETPRIY